MTLSFNGATVYIYSVEWHPHQRRPMHAMEYAHGVRHATAQINRHCAVRKTSAG